MEKTGPSSVMQMFKFRNRFFNGFSIFQSQGLHSSVEIFLPFLILRHMMFTNSQEINEINTKPCNSRGKFHRNKFDELTASLIQFS